MRAAVVAIIFSIGSAIAEAAPASEVDACKQVVVIGHVVAAKWLGQTDLLNGLWNYDIDVTRVLRGQESRTRISVLAGGDAELARFEMAFFLSPGSNNGYGLMSADRDLRRVRAQLENCPR